MDTFVFIIFVTSTFYGEKRFHILYDNLPQYNIICRSNKRFDSQGSHINKGFTDKYNCDKLVYYENLESIVFAIEREKKLKKWKREWKNNLICSINPDWKDLSESIGLTREIIEGVKEHYRLEREV